MLTLRPASPADIRPIAENLRAMDALECAAWGWSPRGALQQLYRSSDLCWTGEIDGKPRAMFGAYRADMVTNLGRPWLLGSPECVRIRRAWVQLAPGYVDQMLATFSSLENWVHRDNLASKRWLRRLGFEISEASTMVGGQPMQRFTR